MKNRLIRRSLLALLVTATVSIAVLAALVWQEWRWIEHAPLSLEEEEVFTVERGRSLMGVARELASRNIIPRAEPIRYWSRLTGQGRSIRAGEYRLTPSMTFSDLVDKLERGDVILHSFTLIEGWTFAQIREALARHDGVEHTLADRSGKEIMAELGKPGTHPEGWFLPETYRFPRGSRDLDILQDAHDAMQSALEDAWSRRADDLPLESPYEALILASIVERETGAVGERHRIAGVFVRRLQRGMRLQTDPTVIYGLPDGEYQGRLRYRHLRTDTPYNTYTRHGLPPTPIAMPGEAALEAAVQPADGDALYFVSRNDGSHHFSETLQEHTRAVRKYQLGEDIELDDGGE